MQTPSALGQIARTPNDGREAFMRKTAGVSIVIMLAAAIVAIWIKPGAVTGQAAALTEQIQGISPYELHLQVDMKSLPVQETGDLI